MKQLAQNALGTGSGTLLYTVPTGFKTTVRQIDIANTGSSTIACAIHLVPQGGSATTSNMLFPSVRINQKTLVQWTGHQNIAAGSFIQGIGGSSGITVTISGDEER